MKEYVNVLPTMTKECNNFRLTRKYINFPLTAEEQAYPIAYIITIHKYVQHKRQEEGHEQCKLFQLRITKKCETWVDYCATNTM